MENPIVLRNRTIMQSFEAAKLLNEAILQSRKNEDLPLVLPDFGFGEGSFIAAELAEMYFETVMDWREKNSAGTKLVLDVLQKWIRYFKKELPEASNKIELRIEDYKISWNQKEGEIDISGGKTELNYDQISLVQEIYGIGRSMLQRYTIYDGETKDFKHFGYRIFYCDKALGNETAYIEEKGYKTEDCPDMDTIWVEGGTEELSGEELKKIAASFFVTDFKADLGNKPDGTKSYELYYGPRWCQHVSQEPKKGLIPGPR